MIWTSDGNPRLELKGHKDAVLSATFSVNDGWLLTAPLDSSAKIWNSISGDCIHTLGGPCQNPFFSVTIAKCSANSAAVLTVSEQGVVKIWSAYAGICILARKREKCLDNFVTTANFSADGASILTVAREHVKIWSATDGQCHQTLTGPEFRDAVFSTDANTALTGGTTVDIWNTTTGQPMLTFNGHGHG